MLKLASPTPPLPVKTKLLIIFLVCSNLFQIDQELTFFLNSLKKKCWFSVKYLVKQIFFKSIYILLAPEFILTIKCLFGGSCYVGGDVAEKIHSQR